jgi:hypothetical protein
MGRRNKMPAQDKTGPQGQGPLTGRGLGSCGEGLNFRRGFRRFGRGFGFCRVPFVERVSLTKEQEKKILQEELAELEAEKKELEEALKKIK